MPDLLLQGLKLAATLTVVIAYAMLEWSLRHHHHPSWPYRLVAISYALVLTAELLVAVLETLEHGPPIA